MMAERGLTLLELMIALAMIAVVASLALPNFGASAERTRLKFAAETLAADLGEARFEAARRGAPLHVTFQNAGAAWCWAVATRADCPCGAPAACQLKTVQSRDLGGIALAESRPALLQASGTAAAATSAVLRSSRGEALKVTLSPLGRAGICAVAGAVPGYVGC